MGIPDAILAIPPEERTGRVKSSGKSFIALDAERFFLRVLLPVRLDNGHEYHFGVWLELDFDDFEHVYRAWDEPAYLDIAVEGELANAVPPWGATVLGARCHAAARARDDALYIDSSEHPVLDSILSIPWPVSECERLIALVWAD
jgi:hypothetical protein